MYIRMSFRMHTTQKNASVVYRVYIVQSRTTVGHDTQYIVQSRTTVGRDTQYIVHSRATVGRDTQ